MRRMLLVGSVLAFAIACGGVEEEGDLASSEDALTPSTAPKFSGRTTDVADASCNVILRSIARGTNSTSGGAETQCVGSTCWYVWTGEFEVSEALVARGVSAAVAYKASSVKTWGEVSATRVDGGAMGFTRYRFRMFESTVRAGISIPRTFTLSVAPFVRFADGHRLFDRNRGLAATKVDVLTRTQDWTFTSPPAVCPAPPAPLAILEFTGDYRQIQRGALVQGAKARIEYALARLPQCVGSTHNGLSAWTTTANARFLPGGQIVSGPVKGTVNGSGTGAGISMPLEITIPKDATSAELWFSTSGINCQTSYDSNFGANYRFGVLAAVPARPSWAGNFGASTNRACERREMPDPLVVDSYVYERACLFTEVDVWIPGVSDRSPEHPEYVLAEVVLVNGATTTRAWLEYRGRVGNDLRYRWNVPRQELGPVGARATYRYRFSTDGVNWFESAAFGLQRT